MSNIENEKIEGVQGTTALETEHQKTPEQIQHEHERQAFETHINTSDETVPENFKDAGAWFDSLKEAQKNYTQSRQEISELREQIATTAPPVVEETPASPPLTNELRIPEPQKPVEQINDSTTMGVDESTYDAWSAEFAVNGEFSEQTKNEIKTMTGFSDRMLKDYIEAQKSRLRESYGKAASVVGGEQNLDNIFKWASNNLSPQDMQEVNMGLASSSYEITLRGLEAMYSESVKSQKAREPDPTPNLTQVAASESGITPYKNHREFKAERNDPKFTYDPVYRDMVQQKMSKTDWNSLPQ